jgi:UDP-glucose 4-epimerase
MRMRDVVLVTGAGGFVGSAVVRLLVTLLTQSEAEAAVRGHQDEPRPVRKVVALLRPDGSSARLDELAPSKHWAIARADLQDSVALRAVLSELQPQAILHLGLNRAAHGPLDEPQLRAMVDAPLHHLFAALEGVHGARIVTTGSAAVVRPGAAIAEDAPIEPSAGYLAYATAKIREEQLLPTYGAEMDVDWIHLRLFYTFGRYEAETRLLPSLVRALSRRERIELTSGTHVRDFTDVDDMAWAYVRALYAGDSCSRQTYHIGSGRGISIREFATTVAEVVGRPDLLGFGELERDDGEQPFIVANPTRANRELEWTAPADTGARIKDASRWWLHRFGALV